MHQNVLCKGSCSTHLEQKVAVGDLGRKASVFNIGLLISKCNILTLRFIVKTLSKG